MSGAGRSGRAGQEAADVLRAAAAARRRTGGGGDVVDPGAAELPVVDDVALGDAVAPAHGGAVRQVLGRGGGRRAEAGQGGWQQVCRVGRQGGASAYAATRSTATGPAPTQVAPTSTPSDTTISTCRPAAGSLSRSCRWLGWSGRCRPQTPW